MKQNFCLLLVPHMLLADSAFVGHRQTLVQILGFYLIDFEELASLVPIPKIQSEKLQQVTTNIKIM